MQILKTGSTGAEVALLQLSLRRAQYGAPAPDGVFGGATKSALQAFQRTHGLTPDGIFGAETERALAPWLRGYAVHTVRPGDTLTAWVECADKVPSKSRPTLGVIHEHWSATNQNGELVMTAKGINMVRRRPT